VTDKNPLVARIEASLSYALHVPTWVSEVRGEVIRASDDTLEVRVTATPSEEALPSCGKVARIFMEQGTGAGTAVWNRGEFRFVPERGVALVLSVADTIAHIEEAWQHRSPELSSQSDWRREFAYSFDDGHLRTLDAAGADELRASSATRAFLRETGLPEEGIEPLHFELQDGRLPTIEESSPFLSGLFPEARSYRRLGWHGGFPVCLEEPGERVVILEFPIRFPAGLPPRARNIRPLNSSIEMLAQSMLAWRRNRTQKSLRRAIARIDEPAIADDAFWQGMAESLAD
jgi:hypothetical protein